MYTDTCASISAERHVGKFATCPSLSWLLLQTQRLLSKKIGSSETNRSIITKVESKRGAYARFIPANSATDSALDLSRPAFTYSSRICETFILNMHARDHFLTQNA